MKGDHFLFIISALHITMKKGEGIFSHRLFVCLFTDFKKLFVGTTQIFRIAGFNDLFLKFELIDGGNVTKKVSFNFSLDFMPNSVKNYQINKGSILKLA